MIVYSAAEFLSLVTDFTSTIGKALAVNAGLIKNAPYLGRLGHNYFLKSICFSRALSDLIIASGTGPGLSVGSSSESKNVF